MPENNSFDSYIPDSLHENSSHYLLTPIYKCHLKSFKLTESTENIYGDLIAGLIGLLPILIVFLNWLKPDRITADDTSLIVWGIVVFFSTVVGLSLFIPSIKKLSGYKKYRTLIVDSAGINFNEASIAWEDIERVNVKVFIKDGHYYPYILIKLLSQTIIDYDLYLLYNERDFLINTKEDLMNAFFGTKPEFKLLRACLGYYLEK